MSESSRRWEDFLNPEILKTKLISASIYLAAFEILKDSIIERIETFFTDGFGPQGNILSPEYETEVKSIHKSKVRASLEWLKEQEAITAEDIEAFDKIRESRNEVAHEMPNLLGGESSVDFAQQFERMVALLRKIEVWWIVNFELAINPDFQDAEIDEDGIIPGPLLTLQLMLEIALGDPEKASYYYDEFRKRSNKS
ncbi:hypothetical protein KUV44_17620 [Marinobacter daepoensis]|uniref:HEPN AbiU2-like domain-containing protein n=1 Tax=Marinobacter daepoensis TaxID=262077 RepID=A0ABS3BDW1_9GAMM|nr:hypothetical protein [Marinobacter daepoensis]MBN7769829.1 hypothetical protein [Marinobacter daepoensis]MBY6080963.1 hypothetical protein [Marinobacter daepoensis]